MHVKNSRRYVPDISVRYNPCEQAKIHASIKDIKYIFRVFKQVYSANVKRHSFDMMALPGLVLRCLVPEPDNCGCGGGRSV